MRPSRPRNDPDRRGDERRRSAAPPDRRDQAGYPAPRQPADDYADDRSRDGYANYRDAPRTGDQRRGGPPASRDPFGPDAYRPRRPAQPRDAERGRGPVRGDDSGWSSDRGRRDVRGARPGTPSNRPDRADRSFNGRRRDGADADPTAGRPVQPRYGVLPPTDDLAWPATEPVDAEWQPAERRPSRSTDRTAPPASGRQEAQPRYGKAAPPADQVAEPAQPAWGDEPDPSGQWQDDLAYDAYATLDEPSPGDADPNERGNGASPAATDAAWDQAAIEPETAAGWDDQQLPPEDDPRAAVFGPPERPSRRARGTLEGYRPRVWGMSGYAWRFARRLTIPRTNRLLRLAGASRVLPASSRARFAGMHLPPTEVDETLGQVRSLDDWAEAWTGTAQRFLGETRRGGDLTPAEAARSRQLAALCYHVAAFFAFGDERLTRTSRSASTTLFGQSLGLLMPETRRVNVRWRSKTMPGYLTVPGWATGRRPLAVLLNGATTSREELVLWSEEFLAQGLAVLALDTPGFAEGAALGPVSLDNDDIMDGIFELAESDPGLDPTKVSLVGVSLGGTMALRAAAQERRVAAVVAVTPPYEPARWLGASSPVSLAQLAPLFGGYDRLADFALGLDLPATLPAVQAQVLVFGAGHDLVIPPPEASRLAAALGEQATLVWFEDGGHALFDALPDWTREAAEWLAVVMDVRDAPIIAEQAEEAGLDGASPDDGMVQPADAGSAADATAADEWLPPEPEPATGPVTEVATPPRPAMAPRSAMGADEPATDAPVPTMARPPEPEPYGAGVFDASQADERRAGQQRGYETGVFGPLGPAAARILADEPTPEPGSPEWGYEERHGNDQGDRPSFAEGPARTAPSTSRLWREDESPASQPVATAGTGGRPVMAQPAGRPHDTPAASPGNPASAAGPAGSQSVDPIPSMGYLTPDSPAVGRGRSSEPFRTVPASEPAQPDSSLPTDAPPATPPGRPVLATPSLAAEPGEPEELTGSPATEPGTDPNGYAPFRPPTSRND